MNKSNAHLYLPLVQALAEGKVIRRQMYGDTGWLDRPSPSFTDPPENYRIKPEPREWWIVLDMNGRVAAAPESESNARRFAGSLPVVHVREVLPT